MKRRRNKRAKKVAIAMFVMLPSLALAVLVIFSHHIYRDETVKPVTPKIIKLETAIKLQLRQSRYTGKSHQLPLSGIFLIKQFEGFSAIAMPDILHDIPTIGYGATLKLDGTHWRLGEKISPTQADDLLLLQLDRDYLPMIKRLPSWKEMSANQQGALLDYSYNLGPYFYGHRGFESISSALHSKKHWYRVPASLRLYRNPGTKAERGLLRRRMAEGRLWATKD